MRQTSAMLDQSHYVNQLACAVGGVLVFVAKSEWRGGDQKKMEKVEFDMPIYMHNITKQHLQLQLTTVQCQYQLRAGSKGSLR